MNDIHKTVLREKNDFLIQEITATHILQKLLLARVIDRDQAAKVLDSHEKSKNEGTELLLQHVSRGSSKSFDKFLEVLRRENYNEVANELAKAVTRKEKLQHSKIPVTPKSNRKAIPNGTNPQSGNVTYRPDEKKTASNKSSNGTKANDPKSDKAGPKDQTFIAKSEGRHISRQSKAQTTDDKPDHGCQHAVRSSINDTKSNATRQPEASGKTKPVSNNGTNPSGSLSPKKTQSSNTTTPVSTKPSKNAANSNSTKASKPSNTTGDSKPSNATNNKQTNARSSQATSNTNPQTTTSNTKPSNAKSSNGTSPSKSSHSTSSSKPSHSTSPPKQSNKTSPSKQPNAAGDSKPVNNKSPLMISSTKLPTKTKQPDTTTAANNKSQSSKRVNEPPAAKDASNSKPSLTASSKPLNSKTAGTGNAKQSKPESNDQQQLHQQKATTGRTPKPAGVQPKTKPSKRFVK